MLANSVSLIDFIGQSIVLMILVSVVLYLLTKYINKAIINLIGQRSFFSLASIGVVIHESSHFIMCYLFNHRVTEVKFFDFDKYSGTLGYVRHNYRVDSIFQMSGNFFIGVAPILGGGLTLYLINLFLPSDLLIIKAQSLTTEFMNQSPGLASYLSAWSHSLPIMAESLWQDVQSYPLVTFVYIFLTGSVALHMFPSAKDFESSFVGLITLIIVVFGTVSAFAPTIVPIGTFINTICTAVLTLIAAGIVSATLLLLCLLPIMIVSYIVGRSGVTTSEHA